MTGQGFEEAQADYAGLSDTTYVGQVRRFGNSGPAYEVVAVVSTDEVEIVVLHSGERLVYTVAELLADPRAETIP